MNKKILKILIVEDLPQRQHKLSQIYEEHAWIAVDNAPRAINLLTVYDFDLIFLDYNLAQQTTGLEVATFLQKSRNAKTMTILHSMNPEGAKKMQEMIHCSKIIPIDKLLKRKAHDKKLRQQLQCEKIDWDFVFGS